MTEMEITYIFIRYVSVSIQRRAKAFYRKHNKIYYQENKEFIESIEVEEGFEFSSNPFFENIEEKLSYRELINKSLSTLNEKEKYIIIEKYVNQRSDIDIGKQFSISSQMISKSKRKILKKLKIFFN